MTKLLVVIGITGKQGGSVASLYSQEPGWKVRGISRNLEKAKIWNEKGVEVVQGDLNDVASLVAAFQGASAIFSTTDFWGSFYNPATQKLLKADQTINQYCHDLEVQQGKNIADAAATVESIERFVISALCDATKWSKGKHTSNYHFDSKAQIVYYIWEKHPELGRKMNIVQVGNYMDNWKSGMMFSKKEDGYHLSMVGSGMTPIPHFDTERDCGSIVRVALQTPPGKNILGVGSMLSWTEYLRVWCEVNKVPFGGFDTIPLDVFKKVVPVPGLGDEVGEMLAFMDEFGYDGGDSTVMHAGDLGVPCPLTTWEAYVKDQDWSSIIKE